MHLIDQLSQLLCTFLLPVFCLGILSTHLPGVPSGVAEVSWELGLEGAASPGAGLS